MLQFIAVCVIIFLLLMGFLGFSAYLSGLKQSPPLSTETKSLNKFLIRDKESRMATETRKEAERTMDGYQDQMRRFYDQQGVPRSLRF